MENFDKYSYKELNQMCIDVIKEADAVQKKLDEMNRRSQDIKDALVRRYDELHGEKFHEGHCYIFKQEHDEFYNYDCFWLIKIVEKSGCVLKAETIRKFFKDGILYEYFYHPSKEYELCRESNPNAYLPKINHNDFDEIDNAYFESQKIKTDVI
jgi:hypothetical protein